MDKGIDIWNEMIPLMERRGELSLVAAEEMSLIIIRTTDDALPVAYRNRSLMLFCTEHFNFEFQCCGLLAVSLVCSLFLVK